LHDVLSSIRELAAELPSIRVVLKVRPNGYLGQYQLFTDEFFPGMVDTIVDMVPIIAGVFVVWCNNHVQRALISGNVNK
jgi:hypothetical protein